MNAPGSPSSPLQITYLTSPGCRRTARHFCPLGNPAPPRPRKPDFSMAAMSCSGRMRASRAVTVGFPIRRFQAAPERGEALMGQVFIQVQGIQFAEMFGGDMHLVFQEGADGGIAPAHGIARHLLLRRLLLQQQTVKQAASRAARPGAENRADENAVAEARRPGRGSGSNSTPPPGPAAPLQSSACDGTCPCNRPA